MSDLQDQVLDSARAFLKQFEANMAGQPPSDGGTATAVAPEPTPFERRALPLIERNVPVIPLRPNSKIAFIPAWENLATTDRAQVEQWGREYPDANVASVAKAQPDKVWFFDADRAGLADKIESETGHKIPSTFMVRSQPGKGHYYFLQNAASIAMGNRQAKDEHGELWSARVDDRYVVGPLSIHPETGKPYEVINDVPIVEAPQWLIDYCIKNDAKEKPAKLTATKILTEVEQVTKGGRNNFLTSKLGRAHQQNNLGYDALLALGRQLNEQHCVPPLPDKEVETIAGSITKYPVKPDVPVPFSGYSQQTQPERPMETELVNPSDVVSGSLDWLPVSTLASTRLQDIYGEYFQDNNWPLTLALPALVTAASVVIPPRTELVLGDNMTNLYTALIAPVNAGKSQVIEWACKAIGIYDNPIGPHYFEVKSGSAEQLIKSLSKKQSAFVQKSCLINPDEWAHLFSKAAIPDASFPTVLTTSFYKRNQVFTLGGTDGGREYNLNLSVSFIGGIVEDEFDSVFGASTLGGLYDRFLFGRGPDGFRWNYVPCPIPADQRYFSTWDLKPVKINPEVYEVTKAWGKEIPGLGRVAEVCTRIATIYASLDGRPEVQAKDIEVLKPLALYQMGLRQAFRPNPGQSPDAIYANKALAWIQNNAEEWTSIAKLKQRTWRIEEKLGPQVAVRSLISLARSGRIDLWLAYEGKPLPADYQGPIPKIGLVRRVK